MLILASRSKARQALLSGAGLSFETVASALDERAVEAGLEPKTPPAELARRLAAAKATAVSQTRPSDWVIGADQTLALGEVLFHKPETMDAARRQLDTLRGRTHRLYSGVALAHGGALAWSDVDSAELTMRDFPAAEADEILRLEGEAILGSVGGYRLEGPSVRLFESIRGDYFTILGLPLLPLLAALRRHTPDSLKGFT